MYRNTPGAGPPRKWNPDEIADQVEDYAANNLVPSINAFCYTIKLSSTYIFDLAKKSPKLTDAIKILFDKKVGDTEKGMVTGKIPPAAGIWILKQLGQSDRVQILLLDDKSREPLILPRETEIRTEEIIDAQFKVEEEDGEN